MTLARCDGAARTYGHGVTATVALRATTCEVRERARIAVVGPSGSGKSTLLHLLAGLETPTQGTVSWPAIGGAEALRPGPVAVIFQGTSLLPALSVEENVALPLILLRVPSEEAIPLARETLKTLGVADVCEALPEELSGGQAQRVGVARALIGRPRLILADEPTGQLDQVSAELVVDTLLDTDAAVVVATHDPVVAGRLEELWTLHGGRLRR